MQKLCYTTKYCKKQKKPTNPKGPPNDNSCNFCETAEMKIIGACPHPSLPKATLTGPHRTAPICSRVLEGVTCQEHSAGASQRAGGDGKSCFWKTPREREWHSSSLHGAEHSLLLLEGAETQGTSEDAFCLCRVNPVSSDPPTA